MKLVRKAYVRCVETYTIELTPEYVQSIKDYLKDRCLEELPILTEKDIADGFEGNWNQRTLAEYHWKTIYNGEIYTDSLGNMIYNVVNDDLWELSPESEFIDTDYIEDEVQ